MDDIGHKLTDKKLAALEKRIRKMYAEASEEMSDTITEYFENFKKRDAKQKQLLEAGEITEEQYKAWRLAQMGRGERFMKLRDDLAERIYKANEVAAAYINDATPTIYSLNRNYTAYTIEQVHGNAAFTLWDERTVRRLLVDEPNLMPHYPEKRAVKRGIDLAYSKQQITASVTSGILQGKSIDGIAKDLQQRINTMEWSNAVRAARTAVTNAQNAGRQDTYEAAADMGIKVKKRWIATKDMRTRHEHGEADGQTVDIDEPFIVGGEEMMFPGDRSGSAWNVYNCRCTMRTVEKPGIETRPRQMRVRNPATGRNELVSEMTYNEWSEWKKTQMPELVQNTPRITVSNVNLAGTYAMARSYEKHRTLNGLTSVPYDELGSSAGSIVYADYGRLSPESASVFNASISDLVDEYDTPLMRIRTMTKNEALGNASSFAFVSHDYTVDSAELVINPVKCKDFTAMTDRIKELSERGYCVKIPDEVAGKYIATHEFAHTLINLEQPLKNNTNWLGADYNKVRKARSEIKDVYERYMSEVATLTKKNKDAGYLAIVDASEETWKAARDAKAALMKVKLSDYSLESADEFMAEAFANEKMGVASNPYAKEVLDILDKYFKR